MAVFGTADAKVLMPRHIADGMVKATRTESVVAKLSPREPQRFGQTDYIVFNDLAKGEYVEEGAAKASQKLAYSSVTAKPHKVQVTMRFNEEVQWADEDDQLGVMQNMSEHGSLAISRALDFGIIHRINPLPGTVMTGVDSYITATTNVVTRGTADADADVRAAVGLLVNSSKNVTGMAIDPKFSWALAGLQQLSAGQPTGMPRYPNLGFGTNITDFLGIRAAQGDTVSGTPEVADTKLRAIVGDFTSGIRWGVQRELPVEIIRFGDPDGQGDLKRQNQIALRLEAVFGWYVFAERFALVKDKAA